MGDDDNANTERMKMYGEDKTSKTHVACGEIGDDHKTREVCDGGSEDAENATKKNTNKNKCNDKEYEFGSDGEQEGGCGSGFAEGNGFNDYDPSENENYKIELPVLEAFETLGLHPNNELTLKIRQRACRISIKRARQGTT